MLYKTEHRWRNYQSEWSVNKQKTTTVIYSLTNFNKVKGEECNNYKWKRLKGHISKLKVK